MPIRFAPAVMSLFGLALAWRTVSESVDWIDPMASVLSIAAVLFGLVTLGVDRITFDESICLD